MPVESPKPALTSIITPPLRLKSPSKQTKASKDAGPVQFGQEERRFVTQLTEGQTGEDISTPRQLEDIELQEKDSSVSTTQPEYCLGALSAHQRTQLNRYPNINFSWKIFRKANYNNQ